jgi:hypothetical protein
MFNSVFNWMNRTEQQGADIQALEAEAKQFKLPSEALPQVVKYVFFAGLALLNYRLFAHAVPGVWGHAIGIVAMIAEGVALYCTHYFSRSASWFRLCLGLAGGSLMAFSLVHGTFSVLALIGVADVTESIRYYSHVVAFPLLSALIGVSVVAITMTHPNNIVRLKQALAHMRAAIGRAEAASDLALMRSTSTVNHAKLHNLQERTRLEQASMVEVKKLITIEQEKRRMVSEIEDPDLRAAMWREMGMQGDPPAPPQWPSDDRGKDLRH